MNLVERVFGTHSDRELKLIYPIVNKIEKLRPQMQAMSDAELRDQTRKFKERLAKGETLDDILPEAFATVREAAKRTLNMEHYPVQLIGGIVLHQGRIAEMKTGEGKTLVSTCPAYLNALAGKGVQMLPRPIALVPAKAIFRITLVQLLHNPVPGDLGKDRRGGDVEALGVRLDEGEDGNEEILDGHRVGDDEVRDGGKGPDRPSHPLPRRLVDV